MKKIVLLLLSLFALSSLFAQNTYKHGVALNFGNYFTLATDPDHKPIEGTLPAYGFTIGVGHVYRPHMLFALNSRIEYISFQTRQDLVLMYGSQFDGSGFNPNLFPGEEYSDVVLSDRIGSIGASLIPNVYLLNKDKFSMYLLAGCSIEMQLHIIVKSNAPEETNSRYTTFDQVESTKQLLDVGFIAGMGFEYAFTDKHVLRIEPTFRMVDLTKLGETPNRYLSRRLFAGVNLAYVFVAK